MKITNDALLAFHRLGAKAGKEFGDAPAKKLSLLLRPAFIAPKGRTLVWGDFSNIEARVLPWLAATPGAEAKLDIFREVDRDPSLPDVYVRTAGDLLDRDPQELWDAMHADGHSEQGFAKASRQSHGKVPELSLGFGGGVGALMKMAVTYGVYFEEHKAKEVVARWREKNAWAKSFWGAHGRQGSFGLWGAINSAIESPDTICPIGRVAYVYDPAYLNGTLFCALPCGRLLTYPHIKWEWREVEDKETKQIKDVYQLTFMKAYGRKAMWHGIACLEGSTLVATDSGWQRLDAVTPEDRVFDGFEWVSHDGLAFKGVKDTMPVDGVRMTPDHRVLTEGGWREAKDCEGLQRAAFRSPYGTSAGTAARPRQERGVRVSMRLRDRVAGVLARLGAVEPSATPELVWLSGARAFESPANDARHVEDACVCGVEIDDRQVQPAVASGMGALRRARHIGLRALATVRELLAGHGGLLPSRAYAGARGQRKGVRAGELHLGLARRTVVEHAPLAADEHEGACPSYRYPALDAPVSLAPRAVYDLLNAGPRRRFMVMGESGPLIVHNCENITQAAAASVLRRTLKRLDRDWIDEKAGPADAFMPVVMHTHDEIVTETREDDAMRAARFLAWEMERNDAWDEGLPLASEITTSWYYSKAVKALERKEFMP